ncbi:hypothetical protein ALC53_11499, partial [Atta colombica]
RSAGKSSRAANCPPSYPPYTLSHTLARNHPYPSLPPLCFPPTRPSHPTHTFFPARSLSSFTIFHRSSPCSRSFPLNSSASGTESGEKSTQGERENGGMGEWSRRMTRESEVGEGKRFV